VTTKEFLKYQAQWFNEINNLCSKKNSDYTGGSGDAFYNFARVQQLGIASVEQGFLTRMLDKMCRLITFSNNGKLVVENEGAGDALKDLAGYCSLFAGYLESKKQSDFSGGEGVDEVAGAIAGIVEKEMSEYIKEPK